MPASLDSSARPVQLEADGLRKVEIDPHREPGRLLMNRPAPYGFVSSLSPATRSCSWFALLMRYREQFPMLESE
jgi:hypothetical protein